jgi:hypothetical protein
MRLSLMSGVHGRNIAFLDNSLQLREISAGFAARFSCSPGELVGADFTALFGVEAEVELLGHCLGVLSSGGAFCDNITVGGRRARQALRVIVRLLNGVLVASVHPAVQLTHAISLDETNVRILESVADGRIAGDVASTLGIADQAVHHRLAALVTLFGAGSLEQMVSRAYSWGVLDPTTWPPRVAAGLVEVRSRAS